MKLALLLLPIWCILSIETYAQNTTLDTVITTDTNKAKNVSSPVDTTSSAKKKRAPFERQLRLSTDLYRMIASISYPSRYGYEFMADYTFREDKYLVLEAGYGGGKINYENLKYKTSNGFLKLGIDISMFDKIDNKDWDIILVGFRYGIGVGQRGPATFIVNNPFGIPKSDQVAARNFIAHWGEITAGMRFEVLPRFFAGWNVRAKFFINSGTFDGQVSPNNISGYGKGDQSTSFDFNFYLSYAIRWKA
ncbi:hypothetical protein DBR32_04910 [Taibaiella sp. KBW10]|uniref:DUF6048 family protein n=1 Tax=Taibaiella sp. KBW10 TaxID=2153357 RepID=UPI000F5A2B0A|nr:DUF6048 family protein [Taibaiella sp. KBW10]RQO31306.1 hypothetical protein DBR32_04910 [Taibaiella sp. KBW10]